MGSGLPIQKLYSWVNDRLALSSSRSLAEKKRVPVHRHSFWYYLGGVVFVFILLQIVTGALLMVYYVPEVKSAHRTILAINSQVDFGWFIRSLHSWGANLLILASFVHLFSTYFMKAYRPPREITWWTGLLLLALLFTFGFSGYLLPWDEMAFFATKIGIDIAGSTPLIGDDIALLLRGGPTIAQGTLSRFFALHVIVLPLLLIPILGLHFFMIQLKGMTEPESYKRLPESRKTYEKFFPSFLLKDLMGWMIVLNLLAILVTFSPWGIGPEADPFAPAPAGIKPEWYFLFLFQLFKVLPSHVGPIEGELLGMLLFGLVVISLIAIPLWDQGNSQRRGTLATWYGLLLLVLFIVLTIGGYW